MKKDEWREILIKGCNGEYVEVACPFLVNEKCSIYDSRPKCCRNFPQDNDFCRPNFCNLDRGILNTEESSDFCFSCGSQCSKKILVPKNIDVTKEFMEEWLDLDCKTCEELFSKALKGHKYEN